MEDYKKEVNKLLEISSEKGGSDLHLSTGYYPTVRIDSRLVPMDNYRILDNQTTEAMAFAILDDMHKDRFLREKEIDFAYEISQKIRCRVNIYLTRNNYSIVFRFIPERIMTLEELNLPQSIRIFSKLSQGFVLIVGPNGHGKSTTLASIIDIINKERAEKIVTIEDPIEYILTPELSIIDQREVYFDTLSFDRALRSTFRENVNVIMVGEMRDLETMSAAVSAAETGHLVFASLHTNNAAQTIERIVNTFPPVQQTQIVIQLANSISGVISQRLIPRIKGGLIPAVEVMIATTGVRNMIREGKTQQINTAIETGADVGMISLNKSLANLVRHREISLEQAEFYSLNPVELKSLI